MKRKEHTNVCATHETKNSDPFHPSSFYLHPFLSDRSNSDCVFTMALCSGNV